MRIAFFGKSKRHTRTTTYIARALEREGHALVWVNERKRARLLGRRAARALTLRQLARFRPELVLIHANDVLPETFEALAGRERIAVFTPDCWTLPLERETLDLARRADLLLTVARGQIPDFLAAGVPRAEFLAEACDPEAHFPAARARSDFVSQVAFIGKTDAASPRLAARSALVAKVCQRFDARVYGRGWEPLGITPRRQDVYPREYREICAGAEHRARARLDHAVRRLHLESHLVHARLRRLPAHQLLPRSRGARREPSPSRLVPLGRRVPRADRALSRAPRGAAPDRAGRPRLRARPPHLCPLRARSRRARRGQAPAFPVPDPGSA